MNKKILSLLLLSFMGYSAAAMAGYQGCASCAKNKSTVVKTEKKQKRTRMYSGCKSCK